MRIQDIVYAVAVLDDKDQPASLAGSAFPVTPEGGFLTCLHVVNRVNGEDVPIRVGIIDGQRRRVYPVQEHFSKPPEDELDLAYIPRTIDRDTPCYLPFLAPAEVLMGIETNLIGYYEGPEHFEVGSFTGTAVSAPTVGKNRQLRLPYAVIEGFSGSPVMTYHNGTKAIGVAFGGESQRVQAYEVVDVRDGESHYRETVHRIVEYGLAYHASVVIGFLLSLGVLEVTVSSERLQIPGIGD